MRATPICLLEEVVIHLLFYKRLRTLKGQSKMDNPEKLTTYDTQDTGQSRETDNI